MMSEEVVKWPFFSFRLILTGKLHEKGTLFYCYNALINCTRIVLLNIIPERRSAHELQMLNSKSFLILFFPAVSKCIKNKTFKFKCESTSNGMKVLGIRYMATIPEFVVALTKSN